MQIEIKNSPAATVAKVLLKANESLVAEGGSLMAYQGAVDVETTTRTKGGGGFFKGLKRLVSGQTFFVNHFSANADAEVWLGTPLPGDILVKSLQGEKLVVAGGSWVANESTIETDLEWQGFKSMFSGENLFWIRCQGSGQVILSSFGFIYPVQVDGEYIVDTGHIVAFDETLNFTISKASQGWLDAFLSGEGLICRFTGRGTVWCQSHNPASFGHELTPYLKPRKE